MKSSKSGTKYLVLDFYAIKDHYEIEQVWFDDKHIYIIFDTGHTIGNPICWFKRLQEATFEQRKKFEIDKFGDGIHWPELDEDLSIDGFLTYKWEMPLVHSS